MLFSVIVPIYNVEKYLIRCIDSVLTQSFDDYELILVDDGSLDNCPSICDDYAKKDKRIKVIHKENGGLVSARQAGVKEAVGDYIFHLDGDDAFCPDALKSAYEIISKTNADIVSFSHIRCIDGVEGEVINDPVEEGLYNKEEMKNKIYPMLLSDKNMKNIYYFLWDKAIKRELAVKHQLNVNRKISLGEDLSCSFPCYMEAESVYMSKKPIYLYTIRGDSLTTTFKTSQITQLADVVSGLRKLNVKKPVDFEEQLCRYTCFMCLAILASSAEGKHFDSVNEIKELILASLQEEIEKAYFKNITIKSKITISMMKRKKYRQAFYFLYVCSKVKEVKKWIRKSH